MAVGYYPESFYSTTLASSIAATDTSISVTTAPSETAGYLVIEANNASREIIKYTGVTGTTLTGVTRGLAFSGTDDSGSSSLAKAHPAGAEIACKDVHYFDSYQIDFIKGTSATGYNTFMIGDGAAVSSDDRYWYAITSSVSAFWGLSSNGQMVVSEDGSTSYVISAGGSGVAAASGLSLVAGKMSVNPADGALSATSAGLYFVPVSAYGLYVTSTGTYFDKNATNTLFRLSDIGDVTASASEVNATCDGFTGTAAQLNDMVSAGKTVSSFHTHAMSCGGMVLSGVYTYEINCGFRPFIIEVNSVGVFGGSASRSTGIARGSASEECIYGYPTAIGTSLGAIIFITDGATFGLSATVSAFSDTGFIINTTKSASSAYCQWKAWS